MNFKVTEIFKAISTAMQSLMIFSTTEQDQICRNFGKHLYGDPIDSEVGDLIGSDSSVSETLFTYLRFNADLSPTGLKIQDVRSSQVVILDLTILDRLKHVNLLDTNQPSQRQYNLIL